MTPRPEHRRHLLADDGPELVGHDPPLRSFGLEGGVAGRLTFLGHSTVLIDLDGVRLLTDPLLGHLASCAKQCMTSDAIAPNSERRSSRGDAADRTATRRPAGGPSR